MKSSGRKINIIYTRNHHVDLSILTHLKSLSDLFFGAEKSFFKLLTVKMRIFMVFLGVGALKTPRVKTQKRIVVNTWPFTEVSFKPI